jgi:adenine phosphoribosyltransferase
MVAIVMEENDNTKSYREKYKVVTAIQPGTEWQRQANAQYLESFKTYKPEMAFPV